MAGQAVRTVAWGNCRVDDGDGLLVEDDEVAVGEVVLGGDGIGRVDPEAARNAAVVRAVRPKRMRRPRLRQMATQMRRMRG